MNKKLNDTIPPITLGHLKKIINNMKVQTDEAPISFEFLLTATFPTVWDNIMEYAKECYTNGYAQALKEMKDENKRLS